MQYLTSITQTLPLTIWFSFYNPHESDGPLYVPRPLSPLGAFVSIEILDEEQHVIYRSQKPKINLKLHPSKPESYLALDPGYTYGRLLVVKELQLAPGTYSLHLIYSNLPFTGTKEHPLEEMNYETSIPFRVS